MKNFEKALDIVCQLLADHECPNDHDLAKWAECKNCLKCNESHYNIQRDINCWKRWALEKAE